MFRALGQIVTRTWPLLLCGWVAVLWGLAWVAPDWDDVTRDAEFAFLPPDAPTRVGEELFKQAFPDDVLGSSVVVVLAREGPGAHLLTEDRRFVAEQLQPRLEEIAEEPESLVSRIRTPDDPGVGRLLESRDGQAMLVVVELTSEFLEYGNRWTVGKIEQTVEELRSAGAVPDGLNITLSGSATLGRDMTIAKEKSANDIKTWTFVIIIAMLLVIYRAPLLAVMPLLTLGVAVGIAIRLLSILAQQGHITLFSGIEVYTTVVVYGAGVDYCLFLTARYKEELDAGASNREAVANSIGKVGAAVAASAGTVMLGIWMMYFAEFGKFQQAGISIGFALLVVLLANLTFNMSLLRLLGSWAFWPRLETDTHAMGSGWRRWLATHSLFQRMWDGVGQMLLKRPGAILLGSVAAMAPFAVLAVLWYDHLSYGLLSELSPDAPSVVGTNVVAKHFPAGATGSVTLLVRNDRLDFSERDGSRLLEQLTDRLSERAEELGIADIRSVSAPLGTTSDDEQRRAHLTFREVLRRGAELKRAKKHYVSESDEFDGHVTRLHLIFTFDPFSRGSIRRLDTIENATRAELPDELRQGTQLFFLGATPSIRDLKTVADGDRVRINILVVLVVFLILVVLLRKVGVSLYLIVSVLFGYLVTLGVTFVVFWCLDPHGFPGIDWTVPIFLFTILVAVGEDYNIFLVTRVEEEQRHHGPVTGVTVALARTGGIISSCGFIMAGTFSSLLVGGALARMTQLGFALAFGVLLDTFVIRPILVPAFLILLHRRAEKPSKTEE